MTIPYKSSFLKPSRPGTYYYITSLSAIHFWESHPFTLSYSTPPISQVDSELSFQPSHGTISPPRGFSSPTLSPNDSNWKSSSTTLPSVNYESESLLKSSKRTLSPSTLTFLIRPYTGFTSRLRKSALNNRCESRVLIDGPYGETQPIHEYKNVLFIIGGAGIAVPLSYLSILLSSNSKVENIKIIWAIREESFLNETLSIDFQNLLPDERFSLEAFITGHEITSDHDSEEIANMGEHVKGVRIHKGRPNVRQEVVDFAEELASNSDVAVMACGPARIADDARASVVEMLGRGWGKMEYFEESFNW